MRHPAPGERTRQFSVVSKPTTIKHVYNQLGGSLPWDPGSSLTTNTQALITCNVLNNILKIKLLCYFTNYTSERKLNSRKQDEMRIPSPHNIPIHEMYNSVSNKLKLSRGGSGEVMVEEEIRRGRARAPAALTQVRTLLGLRVRSLHYLLTCPAFHRVHLVPVRV